MVCDQNSQIYAYDIRKNLGLLQSIMKNPGKFPPRGVKVVRVSKSVSQPRAEVSFSGSVQILTQLNFTRISLVPFSTLSSPSSTTKIHGPLLYSAYEFIACIASI